MKHSSASAKHVSDSISRDAAAEAFSETIEIYATKARVRWQLPVSAEQELRSYSRCGLSEALTKFDAGRGNELKTYAEPRIRGAIMNGAQAMHHARRVGASSLATDRNSDAGDRWDRILDLFEDIAVGATLRATSEFITDGTVEDDLLERETSNRLHTALDSLPERPQNILRWLFLEEMSGSEVAARLGIHKSRLSHMKSQALALLEERMRELEDP